MPWTIEAAAATPTAVARYRALDGERSALAPLAIDALVEIPPAADVEISPMDQGGSDTAPDLDQERSQGNRRGNCCSVGRADNYRFFNLQPVHQIGHCAGLFLNRVLRVSRLI